MKNRISFYQKGRQGTNDNTLFSDKTVYMACTARYMDRVFSYQDTILTLQIAVWQTGQKIQG